MKLKDFLLFISFAIPKAGLKISGFPLYISLLTSIYFFFCGLLVIIKKKRELIYLIIPLCSFILTISIYSFGIVDGNNGLPSLIGTGDIIAYLSSYFAFVCFYGAMRIEAKEKWKYYLTNIFYFLVLYAFAQKIFGDYNVIIPGITANFQDSLVSGFLQEKNNMIWSIGYLKATSTYQNGNLFGVNLLLIGFTVIANLQSENKSYIIPLSVLIITVLLTASASIYFGLIVVLLFMLFTVKRKGLLIGGLLFISVAMVIILFTDNLLSHVIYERLINRNLSEAGGRSDKIVEYVNAVCDNPWLILSGMLFYKSFFSQIYEILPLSTLQIFGLPMLFMQISFIWFKVKILLRTPYILPFVAYFAASISDGAFWLPPTATNMYILLGLCTLWATKNNVKQFNGRNEIA